MKIDPEKTYTIKEAVSALEDKLTGKALRDLIHSGKLPATRVGQWKMFVRGEDLAKIIQPVGSRENA